MFQLVHGMYFRDVPLTDTTQRGVFYTNLRLYRAEPIELPFGRLLPSTAFRGVATITVEAREQLETVSLSGEQEVLVATSGDQLFDEIADVISFGLNAVCVRDPDMARRLISTVPEPQPHGTGPSHILKQTFDWSIAPSDEQWAEFAELASGLIALERRYYEVAMRAIRQVVDAMLMVGEDATLSYTLMVAALESLSQIGEPTQGTWNDFDPAKRARIDAATRQLTEDQRDDVRSAVLANDHLSLQRRFTSFVLDHIEPSFYREEAIGSVRPIKAADLPGALRRAYAIRSRKFHALQELAREVADTMDRSDTAEADGELLLSPEGLARLSRHVIRRFVARAPRGVDSDFQYRSALPGIIRVRMAAQYWIHRAEGFNRRSAPAVFDGMLDFLIEGLSGRGEAHLVRMDDVLDKIEKTALSLADRSDRISMAAIMTLWNAFAPLELQRNLKPKLAACFRNDLAEPTIQSFAIAIFTDGLDAWEDSTILDLARRRKAERFADGAQPMPARIDAALHLVAAHRLESVGDQAGARAELAAAMECVPGVAEFVKFEAEKGTGSVAVINLHDFVTSQSNFVDWEPKDEHDVDDAPGDTSEPSSDQN